MPLYTWAKPTVAARPIWTFGSWVKNRGPDPLSLSWLHRLILAHRRRGAGADVAGEQEGATVNQICCVGGEGAHRSGLAVARCLVEGRRLAVEWTSGRQCSSLGRRGSTGVGEACGMVSWAGGGQAVADVGAQLVEEETAREELTLGVLAVSSSSKRCWSKWGRGRFGSSTWMATARSELWR
jgi:hypothetical protein